MQDLSQYADCGVLKRSLRHSLMLKPWLMLLTQAVERPLQSDFMLITRDSLVVPV